MNVKLETSVTFDFITSSFSTGAAADADSTPSFEVFEADTDTALTLSTSSIAKRTGKTGNYRATFTVAAADGFEAGKSYNVVASATVGSVAGKGVVGRFIARSKDVDGVGLADDAITAGKFDESTAFPLKSADTGSTQGARTGADSDTLETLSDQLDAQLTQSDVRSAVGLASANLDTQLGDLPTNAELSTALAAADDAVLAAIAALNNLSSAGAQAAAEAALAAYDAAMASDVPSAGAVASQVRTELSTELGRIDVATSTRLAAASYTAPANSDITSIKAKTDNLPASPAATGDCITEAGVRTAVGLASANLDTQLGDLPTNSELSTALAGADDAVLAAISVLQGYVDELEARLTAARAGYLDKLNVSGTLAHSDAAATYKADVSLMALESTAQALKVVTDKLATMLEDDGGVYRYSANALEEAPSAGGASAADIADAVCDEALSGHAAPGSVGAALTAAASAGDPMALPMGEYDEGTAGFEIHELYEQVMAVLPDYPSIEVPAPPTAEQSTAWIRCLDEHGAPEGGVTIQIRLVRADEGTDAYNTAILSAVSANGTGLWSQTILRGSGFVYEARRGTGGRWVRFRSANAETVLLPAVLGQ